MKKVLSLLLAVMFVFSLSSAVFADSGETVYDWMFTNQIALNLFGSDCHYCQIDEVDATFWVPASFHISAFPEEDKESGCIGYLETDTGTAFIVLYYRDTQFSSMDALMSSYRANGYNTHMVTINSIPAVYMQDYTSNTISVSFQTKENKLFQVIFFPASDEYISSIYELIISSILPNDMLIPEEAPAEPVAAAPVNPVSGLISK